MVDLQLYIPPWAALTGSKFKTRVVVFPLVTGAPTLREGSEVFTSWLSGPSHFKVGERSEMTLKVKVGERLEITLQVRECIPPVDRGLAGPEIFTK